MSLLVALAATLLLAASLPRRCYAQLCSDAPFNTEVLTNIGLTNYTTYTSCTNIASNLCTLQYGLAYNAIVNCQSNGYIAQIAADNSVCCSCCWNSNTTNATALAGAVSNGLTPFNIATNISCDGYDALQCQQLQSEAQSACQVCFNAGAGCYLSPTGLVSCAYAPSTELTQSYYGSILGEGYECDNGIATLITPYLDSWLQASVCYWLSTVDINGAIAGYVYWSDAGYVVNAIQNGCGVMASDYGPCTGNGVCTTGYAQTYCICNEGWQGLVCDEAIPAGVESCDCGVSWELTLLGSLGARQGYTLVPVISSGTAVGSGAGPWVGVGSLEQAQEECYEDVRCDG